MEAGGFTARTGEAADYGAFCRLFAELRVADPVPDEVRFEREIVPRMVVAVHGGDVVGYGHFQVYGVGAHLVHLAVAPEARRAGCGTKLVEALRAHVKAAGCKNWYLNVKRENVAAIRLYERSGFRVASEGWSVWASWRDLTRLPHEAESIAFTPSAEEDAAIGRALGIPPARLELLRARPNVLMSALRAEDGIVAFAAFDTSFPGIYPIRLARVELSGALFEALRPHARHEDVTIFVEGDGARPLFEMLAGFGARTLLETLQMAGAVDAMLPA